VKTDLPLTSQEEYALLIGSLGCLTVKEAALLISLGNEAKSKRFAEIFVRFNDSHMVDGHVLRVLDKSVLRKIEDARKPEDVRA